MANNEVLQLMLEVLYDLTTRIPRDQFVFLDRPDRTAIYREARVDLIRALIEGDEAKSAAMMGRLFNLVTTWIDKAQGKPRA